MFAIFDSLTLSYFYIKFSEFTLKKLRCSLLQKSLVNNQMLEDQLNNDTWCYHSKRRIITRHRQHHAQTNLIILRRMKWLIYSFNKHLHRYRYFFHSFFPIQVSRCTRNFISFFESKISFKCTTSQSVCCFCNINEDHKLRKSKQPTLNFFSNVTIGLNMFFCRELLV